jgi:hypothetical protein
MPRPCRPSSVRTRRRAIAHSPVCRWRYIGTMSRDAPFEKSSTTGPSDSDEQRQSPGPCVPSVHSKEVHQCAVPCYSSGINRGIRDPRPDKFARIDRGIAASLVFGVERLFRPLEPINQKGPKPAALARLASLSDFRRPIKLDCVLVKNTSRFFLP